MTNDDKQQPEEWLSANEAGRLLGVAGRTVIRMAENGEITGYRIRLAWKFKRKDVDAYLESRKFGPGRPPE